MIEEMVQLERLRTGIPRVDQQWVSIAEIRKSTRRRFGHQVIPRKIDVLWDVMVDVGRESMRILH